MTSALALLSHGGRWKVSVTGPGSYRAEGPWGVCAPFGNLRALPAEQLLGYRVFTKLGVFPGPQYAYPTSKGPCQPGSASESPGSLLNARSWPCPASESHILGAGSGPCIANKLPESSQPWGSSTQELLTEVFSFHSLPTSRKSPLCVEQQWLRTHGSLVFFFPCSSLKGAVCWDSGPGRGFPGSDPPSARVFLLSQLEPSQPGLSCPGPSSPVMLQNRRRATARQQDRVLRPVC